MSNAIFKAEHNGDCGTRWAAVGSNVKVYLCIVYTYLIVVLHIIHSMDRGKGRKRRILATLYMNEYFLGHACIVYGDHVLCI